MGSSLRSTNTNNCGGNVITTRINQYPVFLFTCLIAGALLMAGCPPKVKLDPNAGQDLQGSVQRIEVDLKADQVLAIGLYELALAKLDELNYPTDGLRLRRVKWKKFRAAMNQCWNYPITIRANAAEKAVDSQAAARLYGRTTALRDSAVVREVGSGEVDRVASCPEIDADTVAGFKNRRLTDEAREWARGRFILLNDLRVLLRSAIPRRAAALMKTADGVSSQLGDILRRVSDVEKIMKDDWKAKDDVKAAVTARLDAVRNSASEIQSTANSVKRDAQRLSPKLSATRDGIGTMINTFKR
jgi:hypothetical protein